jgi:hypothetical protein
VRPARKAANLTGICDPTVKKMRSSTSHNPIGLHGLLFDPNPKTPLPDNIRPLLSVTGILYFFCVVFIVCNVSFMFVYFCVLCFV